MKSRIEKKREYSEVKTVTCLSQHFKTLFFAQPPRFFRALSTSSSLDDVFH